MQMKRINQQISTQLLQLAKQVSDNAYAPYSKFKVGAALITEDGTYFTGCNVENASYGLTLCAERNAIAEMVAHGHRKFDAIAISAHEASECYPCGACRQWLYEFGKDARVIVETDDDSYKEIAVTDLLPHAFGPEHLE
jgi:cytidine deaminase